MATSTSTPTSATATIPPYGAPIPLELARTVAAGALAEARSHGWRMAVAIVEPSGETVLHEKDDDTQYGSSLIALRKAQTAARYRRSTQIFEERIGSGGAVHMLSADGILAVSGGIPIVVDGRIVGGVGVSGEHSDQDAQAASAGLAALAAELRQVKA